MPGISRRILSSLCFATLLASTVASAAGPPRQALVLLDMPATDGETRQATAVLEGGDARVTVIVTNREETVRVQLRFRYRIDPDTIAFDEILSRLVVETLDAGGTTFGIAKIVPNEVNLNPNRVPLFYEVTLYRPESGYRIRARVFGNYE